MRTIYEIHLDKQAKREANAKAKRAALNYLCGGGSEAAYDEAARVLTPAEMRELERDVREMDV